jgi:hypothetical protein
MKWDILKKCWPLPIRETHRPRRCDRSRRSRARLWLEELEPRTVPTTITRTSASIFYNDFSASGAPLTSAYAAYQITNTDGVNYADVWATIGNFTSGSGPVAVTLGANAAGAIDLGPLANGQTKTAFFYLGSTADTNVTQTHTVSAFNGSPTSGSLLTSQNFSFAAVQETKFANSNKVSSVVVSPSTPTIGGTVTITVTGDTGNVGAPPVLDFTPAATSSWRADVFQLTGSTITFSNGNTGVFTDTLDIPPGSFTSTSADYTAVYTFQVIGPTATATTVSPTAYVSSSGSNVVHTRLDSPPAVPPTLLASPTITTAPSPEAVTLGTTPVTLKDTAVLENGFRPTGALTFTLVGPAGATVDTETVPVSGNGAYTTPAGFTLPSSGTATGAYQWVATYSGDTDNNPASDNNDSTERVTVGPASPVLVTTASPAVALPTGPPGTVTLSDSAFLSGGFNPTGALVFTLTGPGGFSFTQADAVSGNGPYAASVTLPTAGAVAGAYTWTARYSGDPNNDAAGDQGGAAEQTVASPASPTLTTSPGPNTITLGDTAPPVLTDTATLSGGYHPTGDITFELFRGSTLVHTEAVAVSGNGTYTTQTGFALPTTGTAAGAYEWVAVYSGDGNNAEVSDSNPAQEQVQVIPASPAIGEEEVSSDGGVTGPMPLQIGSPTLAVAVLVGLGAPVPPPLEISPAAPGPYRPPPLDGFAAQRVTAAPLLAADDGQRAGQLLAGGGGEAVASSEAEALPTTLAGRGRETVLPMQPASDTSLGVAFVPEGETYRPLGERLPSDGKGAGENAAALLSHGTADKALRLASSLAYADDSVALVEAITGPEAVSAAGAPPAPPPSPERPPKTVPSSAGAAGHPPGPGREENVAPAGARHWAWLAGAAGLAALLLAARCGWRGRRRPTGHCPVRGSRGGGPVAYLSDDEVNHVRPQ